MKRALLGIAVLVAFLAVIWASDRITLQGERTIFTVKCVNGAWQDGRCTGTVAPGDRFAFRASALRQEVIYWIRGTNEPSGTYSNCVVVDRDNWTCKAQAGQKPGITYEMKNGHPMGGGTALPLHNVPKWKWWAMHFGVPGLAPAKD